MMIPCKYSLQKHTGVSFIIKYMDYIFVFTVIYMVQNIMLLCLLLCADSILYHSNDMYALRTNVPCVPYFVPISLQIGVSASPAMSVTRYNQIYQ